MEKSLICTDCKEYIFKGNKQFKDGFFLTEDYYSDAVCDDCMENYFYCEFTGTYSSSRENHFCSEHPLGDEYWEGYDKT